MLPSPKAYHNLPKSRRYPFDVPGTANISYGHKLAGHAGRYGAKHHVNSHKSILEERPEDKRDYEQVLKIVEFEKETDRKIKSKTLRQRAQQGINEERRRLYAIPSFASVFLTCHVRDSENTQNDLAVTMKIVLKFTKIRK